MQASQNVSAWNGKSITAAGGAVALTAGLAYWLGGTGALMGAPGDPFQPVALTAIIPAGLFLAGYGLSDRFRAFVLAQDFETLTMLQLWRVVGFAFLALYAFDILPGLFAWPAGLGDTAVGLAAPFAVLGLARNPEFARSRGFLVFNLLGLLDFAVAMLTASLASGAFPALVSGPVTSAPMEVWPLNIFPSLFVPFFMVLHLTVLLKIWALAREQEQPDAAGPRLS